MAYSSAGRSLVKWIPRHIGFTDELREKNNFLFAFRSSHSLAEHLREAQEAWEERRKSIK